MKRFKNTFLVSLSILFTIFLSSCGSGTSSSGAGTRAATPFAGQYFGSETLSLSALGLSEPVGTFPLSIFINGEGRVVVTDVDGTRFVGELGNARNQRPVNQFVAFGVINIPPGSGVQCRPARVRYVGTVTGNSITGNSAAPVVCSSPAGTLHLTLAGPFSATRGPAGQAPRGGANRARGGKRGSILNGVY